MHWVPAVMEKLGYTGIILFVMLENLFPPIPSEVILPFAGFMTTRGSFTLAGAIAASTAGSLLGALILYGLGRAIGRERLHAFARSKFSPLSPDDLTKASSWFRRHGTWAVFFGRMMPALRSLISIPAGLARMPLPVFIAYTLAGTLV